MSTKKLEALLTAALALAACGGSQAASGAGSAAMPSFEVERSPCDARSTAPPSGGPTGFVVWQSRGPAGQGVSIESNGRWERRVAFAPEQFRAPDDVTRGCATPGTFAPLFTELEALLASDAGGAPVDAGPPEEIDGLYQYAPCVRSYATGDVTREVGGEGGGCALSAFAARAMSAVPTSGSESAREPEPCAEAQCTLRLRVGHVPHPHESGRLAIRTMELYRDGTMRCSRDGEPLAVRLTNGEAVFAWLSAGASAPAPAEPEDTFEPVAVAAVLDGGGHEVAGLTFDIALERWNALATRVDPSCMVDRETNR